MNYKTLYALLVAFALLTYIEATCMSQTYMQQSSSSLSGAIASRARLDAAANTRASGLAQVPTDFAKLRLAPGFLLNLNVLDDSDFSGNFRVDEQGDIEFPVLGTLHVTGKTISEVRVQIRERLLESRILQNPQVELLVLEYSAPEVTIIGEVTSPGKYPLLASRKLAEVLALAGGTTSAAGNEVLLTRAGTDTESLLVNYSRAASPNAIENVIVHPGDTVQVKRAGIVYVLGAVTRPGGYVMQEDGSLNILQAISLANGTTIAASIDTIHLLRRNADGTEVDIPVKFKKMQYGKSNEVQLRPSDVIFVPTSKVKSTFIYGEGIFTAAAAATVYAVAY
jgi:polysaccharide export outer membrane protein